MRRKNFLPRSASPIRYEGLRTNSMVVSCADKQAVETGSKSTPRRPSWDHFVLFNLTLGLFEVVAAFLLREEIAEFSGGSP